MPRRYRFLCGQPGVYVVSAAVKPQYLKRRGKKEINREMDVTGPTWTSLHSHLLFYPNNNENVAH
jgi:hypothetical protein